MYRLGSAGRRRLRSSLLAGVALVDRLERRRAQHYVAERADLLLSHGDAAIVITTFEDRQEDACLPLLSGLRTAGIPLPIVVVVNGVYGRRYDPKKRSRFAQAALELGDVSFVMSRSMIPLSRCWNLGIQLADADVCVVLNDDVAVSRTKLQDDIGNLVLESQKSGLALGNGSFSHFAIAKACINEIGWFDERFLGVGEEDGDFAWRFESAYHCPPSYVQLLSMGNLDDPGHGGYATGTGKYALACQVYRDIKYEFGRGSVRGMYGEVAERRISESDPYPNWRLHQEMTEILRESEPAAILKRLASHLVDG